MCCFSSAVYLRFGRALCIAESTGTSVVRYNFFTRSERLGQRTGCRG
jgi:hypothetical protein